MSAQRVHFALELLTGAPCSPPTHPHPPKGARRGQRLVSCQCLPHKRYCKNCLGPVLFNVLVKVKCKEVFNVTVGVVDEVMVDIKANMIDGSSQARCQC